MARPADAGRLTIVARDVIAGWITDPSATHVDIVVNDALRQVHTLFAEHGDPRGAQRRRGFAASLESPLRTGDRVSVRAREVELAGAPDSFAIDDGLTEAERDEVHLRVERPAAATSRGIVRIGGWLSLPESARDVAFLVDGRRQDVAFTVRPDVIDHLATPRALGWEFCYDVGPLAASGARDMAFTCVVNGRAVAERRIAVGAPRPQGKGRPLVLMMHIPKTAGTSLCEAIAARPDLASHWFHHRANQPIEDQVAALSAGTVNDLDVVGGHFAFGLHRSIGRSCRYVTVLRDPLEFIRSYFDYRKIVQRFPPFRDVDLLGAMEGRFDHLLDNGYTRFFSGVTPDRAVDDAVFTQACANMDRHFAFVGLVERMPETTSRLSRLLRSRIDVGHLNVTPRHTRHDGLSPAALERLRPFIRYDQALLGHAKAVYWTKTRHAPLMRLTNAIHGRLVSSTTLGSLARPDPRRLTRPA